MLNFTNPFRGRAKITSANRYPFGSVLHLEKIDPSVLGG